MFILAHHPNLSGLYIYWNSMGILHCWLYKIVYEVNQKLFLNQPARNMLFLNVYHMLYSLKIHLTKSIKNFFNYTVIYRTYFKRVMVQAYKSTEGRSFFSWCQIDRMYQSPNFIFNEIVDWYSLLIDKSFRIAVSKLFLRFLQKLFKKMHLPEIHACNSIYVRE